MTAIQIRAILTTVLITVAAIILALTNKIDGNVAFAAIVALQIPSPAAKLMGNGNQ